MSAPEHGSPRRAPARSDAHRHAGYFTRDQAELMDGISWTPPRGYVRAPTRREQSRLHGELSTGGEVMTFEQLDAWARKCQERWEHGYAFIHTRVLLGTRSGEIRVLTADLTVANNGPGSLVDLEHGLVRIRVQATTREERAELPTRIEDALDEQARGRNPKALIFPSLSGGVFGEQNLRNRVWAPAAKDLGSEMEHPGGGSRLLRFTLHSLRDGTPTQRCTSGSTPRRSCSSRDRGRTPRPCAASTPASPTRPSPRRWPSTAGEAREGENPASGHSGALCGNVSI